MKHEWWHAKTAYQIYPKSFYDSNGDGIGDLPGIIEKLPVLEKLGIGILWLSPVYASPLADEGYDISDYRQVDPRFGTIEDLDRLIADARSRNISVLMDLVVNHCSDEHPWFRAACQDPEGEYARYFYIQKHTPGTPLPCNWRGYFGGPVWDNLPGHEDYIYLHVFHKKQPDLNWENPALRREIYDMMNWWLDRGIGGFRIDAIINIKKVLPFKDYPADREDGLCAVQRMLRDADGVLDFLDEMAEATYRPRGALAVAELFDNKPEDLPRFIGENGCFSCIFDFAPACIGQNPKGWYAMQDVTPDQYKSACFASQRMAADLGFMANILENHDEPRGVSHFLPCPPTEAAKKMLGGLSFLLRGLPFLYQGQEIGMENVPFTSIQDVDDCSTHGEYEAALSAGMSEKDALAAVARMSRDNARTPYQWNGSENAGFTAGTPWLRVNPNYPRINLEDQLSREDSLWHFYQSLTRLRQDEQWQETLVYGETVPYLEEVSNLMAYLRKGDKTILVLGNFSKTEMTVPLPAPAHCILLQNGTNPQLEGNAIHLPADGFAAVLLEERA